MEEAPTEFPEASCSQIALFVTVVPLWFLARCLKSFRPPESAEPYRKL
jgi:hypothetical protein